jgi:predicted amidohydrolase
MPRIGAIQTNSSDNIADNLSKIEIQIAQCVEQGTSLVVLPECFAFMQSDRKQLLDTAETIGVGQMQDSVSELAQKYSVWIIAGSLPLRSSCEGKVTNTLIVFDNQGQQVVRYNKIFLFDIRLNDKEEYKESSYTEAGNEVAVVETPVGKIGLSICYDLRFPELYRKLSQLGAQLLVVPSAFAATTGKDHWLPLLQARAIENSCYVVAPAQFGVHNERRKTWGHTVIIDPWGTVLSEIESGWGSISTEIDLFSLKNIRKQLPSLEHVRTDLF